TVRATLLPGPRTLPSRGLPDPAVRPPGRYLYEPDGAVIRAHLVAEVARELDGGLVDPAIAYITADAHRPTPYATAYEITDRLPFNVKKLKALLRERRVGTLTVKKRGSAVAPEELRRKVLPKPHGSAAVTVFLTRVAGAPTMPLGHPVPLPPRAARCPAQGHPGPSSPVASPPPARRLPPRLLRPSQQQPSLLLVPGERRGPRELGAGLPRPSQAGQQVAPHARQQVVVPQRRDVGQGVDEGQRGGGPLGHGHGDRAVEFDDRGRCAGGQQPVEGGDAGPVGLLVAVGVGVAGGDGRLEGVGARCPAREGLGAAEGGDAPGDEQAVPAGPVLVLEQHR